MSPKSMQRFNNYKIIIPDDLSHLIDGFLSRRWGELENLNLLLRNKNFDELEKVGHKIKGHGWGFGFEGISVIGEKIEVSAKASEIKKVKQFVEEYGSYLEYLKKQLKELK